MVYFHHQLRQHRKIKKRKRGWSGGKQRAKVGRGCRGCGCREEKSKKEEKSTGLQYQAD